MAVSLALSIAGLKKSTSMRTGTAKSAAPFAAPDAVPAALPLPEKAAPIERAAPPTA